MIPKTCAARPWRTTGVAKDRSRKKKKKKKKK
jgi:hypothetical protein